MSIRVEGPLTFGPDEGGVHDLIAIIVFLIVP